VLADSPVSFELEVTKTIPLDGSDVYICKLCNVLINEDLDDKETSVEQHLRAILPASTTCATYFSREGKALGRWGEAMKALRK
jgi:flavin reductase (DIM6/NTAB) family NADH-FMN oxidoreductase RutF